MTVMMAGYVRVSTPRQVEKGDSLDTQEKRVREEAKKRGWALTVYREEGISAKDDNRPQYQRMRADLEAGTVVGVVATKTDRLWRAMRLALNEIHAMTQEWGRTLVILDQKIDTTTAAGRAMLNTLLTFGQFEREMTAERVTEGMRARAEKGLWNGGTYPFGYTRGKTKGTLAVHPKDAEVVTKIFDLYLETRSIRRVAHQLNGEETKAPTGGAWCVKTVRGLLKNQVYTGRLVYNKTAKHTSNGKAKWRPVEERVAKDGAVPAVVTPAVFAAAQQALKAGSLLHPRAIASDYLLTGLVRCARCGGAMTGYSMSPNGKRYRYYRCWQAFDKGKTACRGNLVRAEELDCTVLTCLADLRTRPDRLRAYAKEQRVREREEVTPLTQKVGRLEAELKKAAGREDLIMLAFEERAYSVAEMKKRLARLAADTERLAADLAAAQAQLGSATLDTFDPKQVVEALTTALDIYEVLPFEDRRSLLHNLIGEVRVTKEGGALTLKNADCFFPAARQVRFGYNKRSRGAEKPPPYTDV